MSSWQKWKQIRRGLAKAEVKAIETSREFLKLKRLHQYWADQDRLEKRRRDNAARQAAVRSGTWEWMDPRRVRQRAQAKWNRACEMIIQALMATQEMEPVPPCWSSARPELETSFRWFKSEDNSELREQIAGPIAVLWELAGNPEHVQAPDLPYHSQLITAGPFYRKSKADYPAVVLYETDFLQCELFQSLADDARWRTGQIGDQFYEGDDSSIPGNEEDEVYTAPKFSRLEFLAEEAHRDDLHKAWPNGIPERILRHERRMRTIDLRGNSASDEEARDQGEGDDQQDYQ